MRTIGRAVLGLTLGAVMLGGMVGEVSASPRSDYLVCDQDNGGHLTHGVCVLPGAVVGQRYEGFVLTSRGDGGTFTVVAGRLPPGLAMPGRYGAAGTIVAGTPSQERQFTFDVHGTDDFGQSLQQTYRIKVAAELAFAISFPEHCCSPGQLGQFYVQNFAVHGGSGPYRASLSGTLPPGLSFSASPSFSITGTPTARGTFAITVTAKDSDGRQATKSGAITIR